MTPEELMSRWEMTWAVDDELLKLQVLTVKEATRCQGNIFPIVDKTFGLVILSTHAHKTLTAALGRVHVGKSGQPRMEKEEARNLFLDHGYYWSSAEHHLVCKKSFKFDQTDRLLAQRLGFSLYNKVYPFDPFDPLDVV